MRKSIYISIIISLCVLGIQFSAQAGTISPELSAVLKTAKPDQEIDVIVILADQVDTKTLAETKSPVLKSDSLLRTTIITSLKTKADDTQTNLTTFLITKEATDLKQLWIINALAATVRADVIPDLARQPEVAEVRLDFAILLSDPMPATTATPEWNIDAIGAPQLWNLGFTGQGLVVANMDSGVDVNHSDLYPRWRSGTNSWFDPYGQWANPHDSHPAGHGTGTMGVMVGGDATGTSIGVAPGAQWIAVKMFNDAGEAPVSAIHQSFQWLLDPDGDPYTDDAPDVVNNSWGYRTLLDICYLEFQPDIQALKSSQIAVVFSAGNEGIHGPASSISPANNPESFAVGAIDMYQSIAGFSSRGPSACVLENDFFPEVVAPGVNVITADLTFNGAFPINTRDSSGTSFAAPHVAGAMTLLLSAFPALTVSELEAALIATAVDLGEIGPDNDYGYGMIDVMAAYRSLVPCTDADSDEFYVEAVCGTAQDCDDGDNTINPGASEVKHDGIDQDCNGYDLTIDITVANYYPATSELEVNATSDLTAGAALELVGHGSMIWNSSQARWEFTATGVVNDPLTVTVSGIEGFEIASTQQCTDTDLDGYFSAAVCGTSPDCDDTDDTIYPGALEIKNDGIDQDCNGYDLTLEILSAAYNATTQELEVLATSDQGDTADLQLVGFGSMSWNPGLQRWEITVTDVVEDPGSVAVSGVEGSEARPTALCADSDADLDEYYSAAVCGTLPDCNDADNTIYPGATEVKHDGTDQDCNGYDLTIDILSAEYIEIDDTLCVAATSSLGEIADLILVGYPPMIWNPAKLQWEITVTGVGANPGQISVQGIEGIETGPTAVAVFCQGDIDTDGDVDGDDLDRFAAAFGATSTMPNYDPAADLNSDGDVDAGDLAILILNFDRPDCSVCPFN